MTSEKLFELLGEIDDELIERASKKPALKNQFGFGKKYLAAACVAVICIFAGMSVYHSQIQAPDTMPKLTTDISYSTGKLEKIDSSLQLDGEGGGESVGHLIIQDFSQIQSKNPTRDQTEKLNLFTQLPVFKNDSQIKTDIRSEDVSENVMSSSDIIYFDKAVKEVTYDYSYAGEKGLTESVFYKKDDTKSLLNQLLDYTFYRVEQYQNGETDSEDTGWLRVIKPPKEDGVLYPVISLAAAEEKFREGDFYSYNTEEDKKIAKTAKILSVELVYLIQDQSEYIQPYYKFMVTDESWEETLDEILRDSGTKNTDEFYSVSPIFVPAVEKKYQKDAEVKYN